MGFKTVKVVKDKERLRSYLSQIKDKEEDMTTVSNLSF